MLAENDFRELVGAAVLAPSGHNTQPWRFQRSADQIVVEPDFSRRLPVVDPDAHALYISLGCAIENISIAAQQKKLKAEINAENPQSIRITLFPTETSGGETLIGAIGQRQSTRRKFDGKPISSVNLTTLRAAAAQAGVTMQLFSTAPEIERLLPFIREADARQFHDPDFKQELVRWIRFTKRETDYRRDGLAAEVMGIPRLPRSLGSVFMTRLMPARTEVSRTGKLVRSSSALAVFIAEAHDPAHWIALGRSFERLALTATALGIKHAHVNMPCEVPAVRAKLKSYLQLAEKQEPLLMIRLGYAKPMPRSTRRPIDAVIH